MKTISIPYYTSTLDLHVDEANLKAVVTAKMHEYKAGKTEVELVHEALEHPIASPRLRDLAKGKQKVVLVTSDHTRAVPSKITLPILLDEIRQGNGRRYHHPDCHRPAPPHHRGRAAPHVWRCHRGS